MNEIHLYNGNIITYPKSATRFLNEKLKFSGTLSYEDLYAEEYRDKVLYIIVRNPKDNLIGSINVNLVNLDSLKNVMEIMITNQDAHFNTNRLNMLYSYSKFNKNIMFVDLKYLNNFLENVINIPEKYLLSTTNHRTTIIKTQSKIETEEPYLWGLLNKVLNSEYDYYNKIIKSNLSYIPCRKLI
jgi:hypothetical protein